MLKIILIILILIKKLRWQNRLFPPGTASAVKKKTWSQEVLVVLEFLYCTVSFRTGWSKGRRVRKTMCAGRFGNKMHSHSGSNMTEEWKMPSASCTSVIFSFFPFLCRSIVYLDNKIPAGLSGTYRFSTVTMEKLNTPPHSDTRIHTACITHE